MKVVGRELAKKVLHAKMTSKKSELVAILGRRRVGKTYLIKQVLKQDIVFQFSGLHKGTMPDHLSRFAKALTDSSATLGSIATPQNWFEAFDLLRKYISSLRSKKKKVIFLDEFPWMATNRSRFLTAFTDFWNGFAADRSDLVVIICGSSASWMIKKVLRNKGGLHNRVTERLILDPFTLGETKLLLQKKGIQITDVEIIKLYMAIGGIPFYIEQVNPGESTTQFIDRTCFKKNGIFRLEYQELFASLFDNSEKHLLIIETLASHPQGITRDELLQKTKLNSGGGTTSILDELITSGFISTQVPYGKKKKEQLYKIKDHYILFYLKYIRDSSTAQSNLWTSIVNSPSYQSWSGLAFEQICLEHIDQIKKALRIEGIQSTHSAWHTRGDDTIPGAQIDLLIDRADNIINLCEIKFSNTPYTITAEYAGKMRQKMASFNHTVKHRKSLFPTMITSFGLLENKHSQNFIQQSVTAKDLF